MKKIIMFLFSFILLITISFGFNITNLNSQSNLNYFNNQNNNLTITTNTNSSDLIIQYNIDNTNYSKSFNLTKCSNLNNSFCKNISLISLLKNINYSNDKLIKFNISQNISSKVVYLDLENPFFQITNYNYKYTDTYNLIINFSASDNSGKIKEILLYQNLNSDYILLENLTDKSSYNYNIDSLNDIPLQFRVKDLAGNTYLYNNTFTPKDVFKPKIISYFITKKDDVYKLKFKAEDENLDMYQILQNNLILSSKLSSNSIEKEITLPFSTGDIILKILDKESNQVNKTINLDYSFTNLFESIYSNKKEFKFTSNAINCSITSIDYVSKSINMQKNNNIFTASLDINKVKNYRIGFYCNNNNYGEYFTRDFYYDNIAPLKSIISSEKLNDGFIKLNWTKSKDNQSDITYKLYKNDKKIYSGSKLKYIDTDVVYPNKYNYYIKVEDEAQNYINSNKIENIIPKKIKVDFSTDLTQNLIIKNNNFSFIIYPEINSSINVNIQNNNSIIFTKNFNHINSNQIKLNVSLKDGQNKITILAKDVFNNSISKNFYIIYSKPIITKTKDNINIKTESKKNTKLDSNKIDSSSSINYNKQNQNDLNNNSKSLNKNLMNNDNNISNYFWWFILLITIIIVLFAYIMGKKSKNTIYSRSKKDPYESEIFSFLEKRKDDSKLGSSLEKIKKRRIEKQRELEKEKRRSKLMAQKRNLSDFQKKKLRDISEKRDISNIFSSRDIKREEKTLEKDERKLEKKLFRVSNSILELGDLLRNKISKKEKEVKKEFEGHKEKSSLDSYLEKVRSSKSWTNTREYLQKTQEERQKKIDEENIRKLREKTQKEVEKKKNVLKTQKKELEKQKELEEKNFAKQSLDDYLDKKESKKRFYFAEKFVNKDIKKRN